MASSVFFVLFLLRENRNLIDTAQVLPLIESGSYLTFLKGKESMGDYCVKCQK